MMRAYIFIAIVLMTASSGCSVSVSPEKVYGTYVAAYPFGNETITLDRDGTFTQSVAVTGEQPVTVRGRWEFDSKESRANFWGVLLVADGHDHLRSDWRTAATGIVSLDVERHWFRVVMNTSATYPYRKR